MERAAVRFASAAAVAALVQRVVAPLGLRVDESRPWVDARLPGGERFHAVLPPLAPSCPGKVPDIHVFHADQRGWPGQARP